MYMQEGKLVSSLACQPGKLMGYICKVTRKQTRTNQIWKGLDTRLSINGPEALTKPQTFELRNCVGYSES